MQLGSPAVRWKPGERQVQRGHLVAHYSASDMNGPPCLPCTPPSPSSTLPPLGRHRQATPHPHHPKPPADHPDTTATTVRAVPHITW
ncbi:unnamed protein product [Merluccius merluccius]